MTRLHTSGKYIMQIRSNMQDSLDQVSNWCDNNHMVMNPIKTKSVTIATRQKHQLSPLPLDLILNGATIDQVSEHRLLCITIDYKLRWNSHITNVCKTVSRRVFLLSKVRYIGDIDTRKLFFNAKDRYIQNKYILLWRLSMVQPTSDSQILSVTLLFQA